MKKIFKILAVPVVILLLIALPFAPMLMELITARTGPITDVREGDVIFHTSTSDQSSLIQIGTRSKISHCGIVVMKGDRPYVLEARKTLVVTPLDEFIARGEEGRYWHKRSRMENIKIIYSDYLGKPYDYAFRFDNDIYYCSELVYDIYKNQLGIELSEPRKVDDYLFPGVGMIPKLKKTMEERGISLEQYAVAPVDVFNSDFLEDVE